MRNALLVCAALLALACDKEPSRLDALLEASTMSDTPPKVAERDASAVTATDAASDAPTEAAAFTMPPRPIPKPAVTVGSGMPAETQMKAIAYMAAMGQPRLEDAPADAAYAREIATAWKPIVMSMDKGPPEEKLRLNRIEVVAGGRKLDVLMADGCDALTPSRIASRANVPLVTLQAHGVLVVRCNDARVQCLQSTRDTSDVLCTTAPRHH